MNEEQIALETLKEVASDDFDTLGDDISPKMAQNILNLIDKQQKEIDELKAAKNISDFLNEIEKICKKYDLSISHEDSHGGFIIEDYDDYNIEWLKDAIDHTSKKKE